MARFFVGQRVVLVRGRDFVSRAKSHGSLGVVSGLGFWGRGEWGIDGRMEFDCNVTIKWDDYPGREYFQNTAQLEPILPEGAQPSEFSFSELMDNLGVVVA